MAKRINRRNFIKSSTALAGLSYLPLKFQACANQKQSYLYTPKEYDIFFKYKAPGKIYRFDTAALADLYPFNSQRQLWELRSIMAIFQGLINRIQPRLYLRQSSKAVDWLSIYKKEGYPIDYTEISDLKQLLKEFCPLLGGYIVTDPDMLHTLNIAQTLAGIENWMVITPEMEKLVQEYGLEKKEDLRGRWQNRVAAYKWSFDNLFQSCSKHIVGDCCVDFPYHPSGNSYDIRDFLVANKAFTFDLSAALRQRREYKLLDKIYAALEFPAGVWGWHDSRDHEHWAVDRAARKGVYTICASGGPNLTLHGGVKPKNIEPPKQKPSPRKSLIAEKNKVYIAYMMTDGDSLWAMNSLQKNLWATEKRGNFPLSWGFLPLLADVAPAMYLYYIQHMKENDYMVCGTSGAGYTYPHLYPDPRQFLKYSKFYMQRCGLEIMDIANWNDYTNWQEVDIPWFYPLLFEEMDNCLGYVRGMGESAFEPNYNFADKPFIFCGEGIHRGDKDDVDTMKSFIEANPNRPLFVFILINVAVSIERIKKTIDVLQDDVVEFVRLDDFMHLIKSAYKQGLIGEDLYPNREGNEKILIKEAPASWQNTKNSIERLVPIINAPNEAQARQEMNSESAQLALGQEITDEDRADILAFALCENMFRLVKDVLNYQGIYVNLRIESIEKYIEMYGQWPGIDAFEKLTKLWQNWDQTVIEWPYIIQIGKDFLKVYHQSDKIFF